MSQNALKVIFAGTPEFARVHLAALLAANIDIVAVYTQPDRPAGRGKKLTASPVKTLAIASDIPVLQPKSLRDTTAQAELKALNADLMIVVAYGLLLPQAVLDTPKFGCINVHGSILPRWRGAAPIQRAIEAGDTESGVTIMQMDIGLDTGDMLLKASCPILPTDTSADLHDRLCDLGPNALLKTLEAIEQQSLTPEKQDDSLSNYAKKIEKNEACIDWSEDAHTITRKVLAFNPFPVCYSFLKGERIKIHRAHPVDGSNQEAGTILQANKNGIVVQCGKGALAITQIQLPGKKAMAADVFVNGFESTLKDGQGQYLCFSASE